jgi:polyvinyl alcohol dehydrogenase (cytochrome)
MWKYLTFLAAISLASHQAAAAGQALYDKHCASCHGGTVAKAPPVSLLAIMSASSIYRAMDSGIMQAQSAALSDSDKRVLAEHLTGQTLTAGPPPAIAPACEGEAADFDLSAPPDVAGWGVSLDNRRRFSTDVAGLAAADLPQLELRWAVSFPGAVRARSQPAIAGGALYVGSQDGTVYALEQRTGCLRWTFSTVSEVRTGIVVAPWQAGDTGARPQVYFGDLTGNVYAVDAVTGELSWRDRPDDHPSLTLTAAPTLHGSRLYVPMSALEVTEAADPHYACCTFRGGVAVYDTASGKKLWTGYTIDRAPQVVGKNSVGTDRIAPSGAPIWGTPALDPRRKLMYVGTGENYSSPANDTSDAILALSMEDGRIVWRAQMTAGDAWNMGCETEEKVNCPPENGPDYDFGAPPILAPLPGGGDILLAGQKSGDVYGLDPATGEIIWRRKIGRGGIQGGVHFGMAVDGDTLYVPMSDFDGGPRWPGKPYPGMYALDLASGETRWFTRATDVCAGREFCQPGLSAPASAIDGAVVAGAMDGHLRAYDRTTGKVIWDVDTAREFRTLNGQQGRGGSIGGGTGPVFSRGMLYVNSGYGIYFHMPGNVLLAYGPPR